MATVERQFVARHIQNHSEAASLEPHWGYVDRVMPCTNDAGSCEYLELVYGSHDRGMLYSGILWATIAGILFLWAIGRRLWPSRKAGELADGDSADGRDRASRLRRTLATSSRSYLLQDCARPIFGRTTRLQVLILAVLAVYLLIWSFVGMAYRTWVTPVKSSPGLYNVRTTLGPFSDRIGILAYALTPLSILLSSRESILSLITGVPYQSFNFLHRWLGYIIFVQSTLHTIAWTIVEVRLYQPQPSTAITWIKQTYMIWGCVAMILLLILFALSTPWGIRLTGYEFFRKSHYVLAMVYIGACIGHWVQLDCFLIPSLVIWFLDRAVRLLRTALIHYQYLPDGSMAFKAAQASVTHFPDAEHGDVVRMDFKHNQEAWKIGQHFYLCFPESSIWQSHPFTPLNLPEVNDGVVAHSYIFRAKGGETKKMAQLVLKKQSEKSNATTPLILSGPYGDSITDSLTPDVNVLCVAGGTGITYVLPVLLSLIRQPSSAVRKIELIWAVRHKKDIKWVEAEIDTIRAASRSHGVAVHIYVTREQGAASSLATGEETKSQNNGSEIREVSSSSSVTTGSSLDVQKIGRPDENRHPDLKSSANNFLENTIRGRTMVIASGPGGMISDLRTIVAGCNSATKVWRGNERYDVSLTCDDRLEW